MKKARVIFRLLLITPMTAAGYLLLLAGKLVALFSLETGTAWRRYVFRQWARGMAAIMGMKVTVHGAPPRPPFFLVANHLSYIDILLLATQVQGVFVSRHDVRNWPVVGLLARTVGTLFINRESVKEVIRMNAVLSAALAQGEGIILFPEGTSTAGTEIKPFKSPLLSVAAGMNYPVSYASLSYHTSPGETPAHLAVCWWGDMPFAKHVLALLQMPEFYAMLIFGNEEVQETDRKVLAKKLHALIAKHFTPVVSKDGLNGAASENTEPSKIVFSRRDSQS